MAGSLGKAILYLMGDDSGLKKTLGGVEGSVKASLGNLGGAIAGLAGKAIIGGVAAIGTAVVGIGAAAFAAGKDFDAAFDGLIEKTGATGTRLETLKADATAVFTSIPTDIDKAADVVGTLNQRLGVTGKTAQELAKQLLLIGTPDATKSTELYTRVMGDWGIKNEDASATLDKLFKASQITGVGVDDLMSRVVQFGAPLRLMGFSIEESAAMFGKWEKEGVNSELVMGSLRIAAGKFAKENIPLKKGLSDTMKAIKGTKDESKALAMGMEVFGARAGPDMVAAIREGRFSIDELMASMKDSKNAILDTANATMDFPEKLKTMKNKVMTVLAPLGLAMMDTLSGLFDGLQPAFDGLIAILASPALQGTIKSLAEGLSKTLQTAINWLVTVGIPALSAGWAAIQPGLKTVVGLIDRLATWLGTNLAGAVAIITDLWGDFADGFSEGGISVGLSNLFGRLGDMVTEALPGLIKGLGQIWQTMLDWVSTSLPGWLAELNKFARGAVDWVMDALPGLLANVGQLAQGLVGALMDHLPGWIAALLHFAQEAIVWIVAALPGLVDNLGKFWNTMVNWVVDNLPKWVAELQKLALELIDWVVKALPGLAENLGKVLGTILKWIGQTIIEVTPKLFDLAKKFLSWVATEVLPRLPGVLGEILVSILKFIGGMISAISPEMGKVAKGIIDGLANGIRNAASSVRDALSDVVNGAISSIKARLGIRSPSTLMADLIGEPMALGIGEGFGATMGKLKATLSADINGALSGLTPRMAGMGAGAGSGGLTIYVDARGATDPAAVERRAETSIRTALVAAGQRGVRR